MPHRPMAVPHERDGLDASPTSLSTIDRLVVVTLHGDMTEANLAQLRADLLERVRTARATGAVFDVSSLMLLDPWEFEALQRTAAMVRLLGARPVLAGLRPVVVEVLASLDVAVNGFDATVATVHDALTHLQTTQATDTRVGSTRTGVGGG